MPRIFCLSHPEVYVQPGPEDTEGHDELMTIINKFNCPRAYKNYETVESDWGVLRNGLVRTTEWKPSHEKCPEYLALKALLEAAGFKKQDSYKPFFVYVEREMRERAD
ncbi:hypothetical protein FQN57_005509 [Myotisia sp. PD_48]|nr:hypothetical protein FQN57_005509 [Myotisia sp. PD_48]